VTKFGTGELLWAGMRHPRLAFRFLRGRSPSCIDIDEFAQMLPPAAVIIEAGCADGMDTLEFAKRWPRGRIIALEPVPCLASLASSGLQALKNVEFFAVALSGNGDSQVVMHSGDETNMSSSVLKPTSHKEYFPEIEFDQLVCVPAVSLDALVLQLAVVAIDLLWLDLQGYELAVLRGGGLDALSRTSYVHLEVAKRQMYEGAPLWREVYSFMDEQGFSPIIERVPIAFGNVLFKKRTPTDKS
jgi:FkbM family methyltransferase